MRLCPAVVSASVGNRLLRKYEQATNQEQLCRLRTHGASGTPLGSLVSATGRRRLTRRVMFKLILAKSTERKANPVPVRRFRKRDQQNKTGCVNVRPTEASPRSGTRRPGLCLTAARHKPLPMIRASFLNRRSQCWLSTASIILCGRKVA